MGASLLVKLFFIFFPMLMCFKANAEIDWQKGKGHPYIIRGRLIQKENNFCYGEIKIEGNVKVIVCALTGEHCPSALQCYREHLGLEYTADGEESAQKFSELESTTYNGTILQKIYVAKFKILQDRLFNQRFEIESSTEVASFKVNNFYPAEFRYLRDSMIRDLNSGEPGMTCQSHNRLTIKKGNIDHCYNLDQVQLQELLDSFKLLNSFLLNKQTNAGILLQQALRF